jgi:glycosyltransferase involved in cell wall biosynthesis
MLTQWQEEGVIEWWGWRSDMPSVYQQCHVVALPTAYGEGVPTALLEAAACGKPLVASDIPGCRAVVQG